jgi:predicted AlkP superfamily phosphohydrolase/phosphomutase
MIIDINIFYYNVQYIDKFKRWYSESCKSLGNTDILHYKVPASYHSNNYTYTLTDIWGQRKSNWNLFQYFFLDVIINFYIGKITMEW